MLRGFSPEASRVRYRDSYGCTRDPSRLNPLGMTPLNPGLGPETCETLNRSLRNLATFETLQPWNFALLRCRGLLKFKQPLAGLVHPHRTDVLVAWRALVTDAHLHDGVVGYHRG